MSRPTANDVHIPGMMNQRRKKPIQKPWTAASVPDNLREWPEAMVDCITKCMLCDYSPG